MKGDFNEARDRNFRIREQMLLLLSAPRTMFRRVKFCSLFLQ
jgi:hypothetical protein